MLKLAPPDRLVFGNVDPAGQFRNGTPESVRETTLGLLEKCAKYGNFILSSGCDIPPASPMHNIEAFFSAAKDFYS
jgi:uroporphyrinogen decarboxylase